MSIHRSLKSNTNQSKRTVHKRWERVRSLMLQKKFDREKDSVFGLPKQKIIKYKIKKEKKEKEEKSLVELATTPVEDKKEKKKSKDVGKIK